MLIDGKKIAKNLRDKVAQEAARLYGISKMKPGLAVVIVGDDTASQIYVRNKIKFAKEVGFNSFEHRCSEDITQEVLIEIINKLNTDSEVHGILVQLPLPNHISEDEVINKILFEKDVDGFTIANTGKLSVGQQSMLPCTALGVLILLKEIIGDLSGKEAIVIGRSNIVGKPVINLLLSANCTVTCVHSKTRDLANVAKRGDIIVSAVGKANFVDSSFVKPGAVIIDVGINSYLTNEGKRKVVGDVNFEDVVDVAGAITPVPGGVGPMTIACLLYNTLLTFSKINKIDLSVNI